MSSAAKILKIAAAEIGYSRWNDPLNGTKYGRWYAKDHGAYFGTNGVPYCAMFVSWVFAQAGQKAPGLPTAACGNIRNAAKGTKYHIKDKKKAKPGDIVLFRWDGDANNFSYSDHVGIVEKNCGSYIQTIEGNTSSGNSGSQGNGGGVYRRTRSWGVVQMIIRPDYDGTSGTGDDDALEIDGIWGEKTTLKLQKVLKAPYNDGKISRQNPQHKSRLKACTGGWEYVEPDGGNGGSQTIKLVQRKVGVKADGFMGPDTINALIDYYKKDSGADVLDGKLEYRSITVKAMQRALNKGEF